MEARQNYLRFLSLRHAFIGPGAAEAGIDRTCVRLLEAIAVAAERNARMTVSVAMQLESIASPATLHRKLALLEEAGYIQLVLEKGDRRTKYLVPTSKAVDYFSEMGRLLIASQSAS